MKKESIRSREKVKKDGGREERSMKTEKKKVWKTKTQTKWKKRRI